MEQEDAPFAEDRVELDGLAFGVVHAVEQEDAQSAAVLESDLRIRKKLVMQKICKPS